MKRFAFKMKLRPGFKEEYIRRHNSIWPELKTLLTESGVRDYTIFLDEETKSKLTTWEPFISYYLQLTEAANSYSWIKADVLLALSEKFGEQSLEKVSADIGEPRGTVVNYVRTSKAFPPETREPSVSFSVHFQASYADSYDEKSGTFSSNKRFEWVEKAADKNLSTRSLRDEIQEEKEKEKTGKPLDECNLCGKNDGKTDKYVFFAPNTGRPSNKFKFHIECYAKILKFIEDNGR